MGVLLPPEEWGSHDLKTTVNRGALAATALLGAVGLVLMYLGNGGAITFLGIALFLGFMALITVISLRAVEAQAQRLREEEDETRQEFSGADDSDQPPATGEAASR